MRPEEAGAAEGMCLLRNDRLEGPLPGVRAAEGLEGAADPVRCCVCGCWGRGGEAGRLQGWGECRQGVSEMMAGQWLRVQGSSPSESRLAET